MQSPDQVSRGNSRDRFLFAAHDGVNALVLLVMLGLPYAGSSLLVQDYLTGKILHLLGLMWFFGGLILATFCVSRFIWMQPSLDHEKIAYGFRFILVLELCCIPSIALMAYGGMAMASRMGGFERWPWAYQGYLMLLYSPPVMMIIPRLYHKRLIKNAHVHIEREKRLAFWQDWSFIAVMTLFMGYLTTSMLRKFTLFWRPCDTPPRFPRRRSPATTQRRALRRRSHARSKSCPWALRPEPGDTRRRVNAPAAAPVTSPALQRSRGARRRSSHSPGFPPRTRRRSRTCGRRKSSGHRRGIVRLVLVEQLDLHQRNVRVPAKRSVVLQLSRIPDGIEEGSDRPEVGHAASLSQPVGRRSTALLPRNRHRSQPPVENSFA